MVSFEMEHLCRGGFVISLEKIYITASFSQSTKTLFNIDLEMFFSNRNFEVDRGEMLSLRCLILVPVLSVVIKR